MYKMGRMILSYIGWVVCCFMGLSGSMLAWLMPLFDIPPHTYLAGCLVASLVIAWRIECGAED